MIKFKNKGFLILEIALLMMLYILPIMVEFIGKDGSIFINVFNERDGSIFWVLFLGMIVRFSLFFINVFYLIPYFFIKKKFIKYVLFLIIVFAGFTFMQYEVREWLKIVYHLPENLNQLYPEKIRHRINIDWPVWKLNSWTLIVSFMYRFSRDWIKHEIYKKQLLQEKTNAELQFLRSQINPHFLFNTLNGIYAISKRNKNYEASEAIEKLSTLMRFMLYESNAKVIPLEKEIAYIHSLIEIQQLRTEKEELIINLSKKGVIKNVLIPPMLLIPLIENAFKHTINLNEIPIIKIEIEVINKVLKFQVSNKVSKIHHSELKETSESGLKNIKKRLNLIYPKKHTFDIFNDNSDFKTLLTIDLS